MDFTTEELVAPTAVGAEGWDDFVAANDIRNLVQSISFGTTDFDFTAEEMLPEFHDVANRPRWQFIARRGDAIVACAVLETQTATGYADGYAQVYVLPDFRHAGIGRALSAELEKRARAVGIPKLIGHVGTTDDGGERLAPPTAFGSVPANDRAVRLIQEHGYRLEQIERSSRLTLPVEVDELEGRLADALRFADGYRLHPWSGPTPPEWLPDMAILATRMSTDAPHAGLDTQEDPWTVERVAQADIRGMSDGRTIARVVAEHVASGRLVGFTDLDIPASVERPVAQGATLVLIGHRGHRLGAAMKVANLLQLQRIHPGHPSIFTFNAEENRYMLSVNEAIGFVSIAAASAWRKDLE